MLTENFSGELYVIRKLLPRKNQKKEKYVPAVVILNGMPDGVSYVETCRSLYEKKILSRKFVPDDKIKRAYWTYLYISTGMRNMAREFVENKGNTTL